MKTIERFGMLWIMLLAAIPCCALLSSCSDDEDEIDSPIVGKWQQYQRIHDDGTVSEGDTGEYWIFNADGSFRNEDGGELCTIGTFEVNGDQVQIWSHDVEDSEDTENITGTFTIAGNLMTLTYTYEGDPYPDTLVFKRAN